MAPLVQMLICLCVLGLVYWAIWALPLPQVVRVIASVVVGLVGITWVAHAFGVRMPW